MRIKIFIPVVVVCMMIALAACSFSSAPTAQPTLLQVPKETRAAVSTLLESTRWAVSGSAVPATSVAATIQATAVAQSTIEATAITAVTAPAATASPMVGAATTPQVIEHTVQFGENLVIIAKKYGVTAQAIAEANGITNPSLIVIGQKLRIPQPGEKSTPVTVTPVMTASPMVGAATTPQVVEHTVQFGENLVIIAKKYGITAQAIAEANGITNPSLIVIGQKLRIPQPGEKSTPIAAVPTATVKAESTNNPGGSIIAFQLNSGGDIYTVNADGSGLQRLTSGMDPAWSPDGQTLAFVHWTTPWGLYLVNADGSNERLIVEQNLVRSPTWASDGKRLAFTRQEGGEPAHRLCYPGYGCFDLPEKKYWRLGVVNVDGSNRENPPDDMYSLSPSWSPTGGNIVYDGEHGLRLTQFGISPSFLLEDVSATFPSFSPDGNRVAFMYDQQGYWDIYVVNADGSGKKRLTESSPLADKPTNNVACTWSPDGKYILFLSDRDGRWRPYIMQADGSGQKPFLPSVFDKMTFTYDYAAERVFSWH